MKSINGKWLSITCCSIIVLLLITIAESNISAATSKLENGNNITLYYASTRNPVFILDPLNPYYELKEEPGYNNDEYLNFSQLQEEACRNETVAIFVHGWEESEKNAQERLNRVKLSLEHNNYTGPLAGFSWPSDTVWLGAQFIAEANGPKLAKLIFELKKDCPGVDIRIIAHSLGARVVLSSLDSLHKNPLWNDRDFKIESVHLMGAAVDDEEVSNRSEYVLIDETNWGTPKSDYGHAIEEEVVSFSNLLSSKDNMLEPNPVEPSLPIYPLFESDLALGQSGYQKILYNINSTIPKNYNDIDVTDKLVARCDADGDGHRDKPFLLGQNITVGDNHRGYLGYRDVTNTSTIIDDGAIDVVVDSWHNKHMPKIKQNLNSSSVC